MTDTDDKFSTLLLIGHNPAVSELSALLDPAGADADGLRTCGLGGAYVRRILGGVWSAGSCRSPRPTPRGPSPFVDLVRTSPPASSHQIQRRGLDDATVAGQPGQHLAGEEAGRGDLALVEGAVGGRQAIATQGRQRHLGLTLQQPPDDQVAQRQQDPPRRQPNLVQLGGLAALGRGEPAR